MLGVLDRERVELEDVAQDREVVVAGLVEVEPEEAAVGEQLLHGLAAEVDVAAAVVLDDVADRRPGHTLGRVRIGSTSSLATTADPNALGEAEGLREQEDVEGGDEGGDRDGDRGGRRAG